MELRTPNIIWKSEDAYLISAVSGSGYQTVEFDMALMKISLFERRIHRRADTVFMTKS